MPSTQNALDNLRHRLMLIDPELPPTGQQRKARFKRHFITRLVSRTREPFKPRHNPMQSSQRFNRRHRQTTNRHRQRMRRSMQTELRILPEHPLGADVLLDGSEFNAIKKWLTQLLLTLKRQHIKRNGQTMNNKLMATVVEEKRQHGEHE